MRYDGKLAEWVVVAVDWVSDDKNYKTLLASVERPHDPEREIRTYSKPPAVGDILKLKVVS